MRKSCKRFFCFALLGVWPLNVFSMGRPQVLEIDGQKISPQDRHALLYGAIPDESVIAEFKSVKLNGQEMTPYILTPGRAVFVNAEKSSGDSTPLDQKLKSLDRVAVICEGRNAIPFLSNYRLARVISLEAGQAAFLMPVDKEFVVDNKSITMFLCPQREAQHRRLSPTKSSTTITRTVLRPPPPLG